MNRISEHIVPDLPEKIRLVEYLPGIFDLLPSKASVKKVLKRGEILIDGEKAVGSRWVVKSQVISLLDSTQVLPSVFELKLKILYEDDFLAVIIKPAGIPVSGNFYKTIQNALLFNLEKPKSKDALKIPRPIHRLDIPTSGLLVIAKTATALMLLGQQLQKKDFEKRYRAIVAGKLNKGGSIPTPIKGQTAKTDYKLVKHIHSLKVEWLSEVDLFPITGRTHQLRIHMSGLGHPIVGDKTYSTGTPILKGKGLFLSAVELNFKHPVNSGLLHIKMPQPEKFDALICREERRWKNYQ